MATAPAVSSTGGEAWRDYEAAAQIGTVAIWDEFLRTHTSGFYANLARAQRAKLMATAGPPPAATVAAIPPPAVTRTLSEPEPKKKRERRTDTKRARSGSSSSDSNSAGCASAKRTLRAAMALGFDNRDGVITAVRAKCGS